MALLDVILGYDCNLACDYCTITPEMRRRALSTRRVLDALKSAVAEGFDRPGHLQPDDVAGPGRRRILARGLEEVGAVDPGRGDANEDLTRSGCHVGNGLPGESFGRLGHDREHSQNATTLRERAAGSASCGGHAVLLLDDGGDHWGAYCERYAWIGHC